MKKTLLFCFFIFLTVSVSNLNAQKLHFGIQTGVNWSNIHVTDKVVSFLEDPIYKPITFYTINGYLSFKSNSNWGISIEPGFIKKGAKRVQITMFDPYKRKNTSSYIQFPILYDLYFLKKFCLSIGPEFTYLLESQDNNYMITNNSLAQRKRVEIAGLVGINYNIYKVVDVGFRYNHSISATYRVWYNDFGDSVGLTTEYNCYFQTYLRVKI
jgi:hypothetical protein